MYRTLVGVEVHLTDLQLRHRRAGCSYAFSFDPVSSRRPALAVTRLTKGQGGFALPGHKRSVMVMVCIPLGFGSPAIQRLATTVGMRIGYFGSR